jgi:hypothetical protein
MAGSWARRPAALELAPVKLGEEPADRPPGRCSPASWRLGRLPASFFGMLHSGQPDLAARSSEILRADAYGWHTSR